MRDIRKHQTGVRIPQRQTNIELLRIITMLSVIAHHYVVNSGLLDRLAEDPINIKSAFFYILGGWGKIGINIFVFITGYYMCTSRIKINKFLRFFLELMFYKIVIECVFWISGYEGFSIKALIDTLIPFRSITNGFMSCFLIFYLLIPFLNTLISTISEKQHVRLIAIVLFVYTLFTTLPNRYFSVNYNYISWFITLFIIASYIRLYPRKIYTNKKFWAISTIILLLVDSVSIPLTALLTKEILGAPKDMYMFVSDSPVLLALLTSISVVMLFLNIKIKYNRTVNYIASSTLGVLLIHTISDTMRRWLWKDIFKVCEQYTFHYAPLIAIISCILIFVSCTVVDKLRIHFVEKPVQKLLSRYDLQEKCKRIEDRLFRAINI